MPTTTFTLRQMQLTIVIALVLPALLIGVQSTLRGFQEQRRASDTHAQQVARDLLLDIQGEVRALRAVAGALASSPSLPQGDFAAFYRQAIATQNYFNADRVVLSAANGQQLMNTRKPYGTALPQHANPALLARAAASAQPQVSDLYKGAVSQTYGMSVCLPVLLNGQLRYFLDAGLDAPHFAAMLSSRQLPEDWIVSVFDASGTFVARSRAATQFVGTKGRPEFMRLIADRQQGHATLTTLDGIPVYTSFVREPENGWAVAIGIPSANIDAALWRDLAADLLSSAGLLAIGLWLASRASTHIRQSMQELVAISSALGQGTPLPRYRAPLAEAHMVAQALTAAAGRLQHSEAARAEAQAQLESNNLELEQRVQARTAELQLSRHMISSIIEHLPAMICVKRASDLRYELFNHGGVELTGRPRTSVIGRTDQELQPGAVGQALMASEQAVLDSLQALDIPQHAVHDASGATRYLHTRKMALLDPAGHATHLLSISLDITDSVHAAEQLRIAAVAFESQEPTMITDAQTVILRVNSAFTACTGYSEQEVLGQTPRMLQSGRHDRAYYTAMWDSIQARGTWQGECWDRRKNGEIYPTWTIISAIRDPEGTVRHYVGTQTDISLRKQTEEEIRQLAFYDPLTKLPNRRLLFDRLRHTLLTYARSGQVGALMFIDLDNFKTLNDTLGHDQGDQLLRQVAERLPEQVRRADTVARLGGDEFVVMLDELGLDSVHAAREAQRVGEAILAALNRPYQVAGRPYHCTPSIGIALLRDHNLSVEEAVRQADLAMYQAKAAGRNTLRFFEPQMQLAVTSRVKLEHDLQQALLAGDFELYYQPQVDTEQRIIGAEALLRWHQHDTSIVLPDQFIELAEANGFIVPLGQWVLQAACRELAEWANEPMLRELTLAVNVSPRQFLQADFVSMVHDALRATHADPQRLKLEITESLLLDDFSTVVARMEELKRSGIGFALDDFGMGYSSLSYLKQLPLEQLKIDRSFARDVLNDPNDAAIARIIVLLGHTLGLSVVAEGVETEAQRQFLASSNCNAFQGLWFSGPLPAGQFRQFVLQASADRPA